MSGPITVALATGNPGKVREIAAILADTPLQIVAPQGWTPPPETADTYVENALAKARSLVAHAGVAAIADDSGIEADALGGRPGVRSARFAGEDATDAGNLRALLDALRDVPDEARTGRFRCLAVCVAPDGREWTAEGVVEGRILREPRGAGGFGYDPVFVPAGHTRTTAEMPPAEKDALSHRGKAVRALAVIVAQELAE